DASALCPRRRRNDRRRGRRIARCRLGLQSGQFATVRKECRADYRALRDSRSAAITALRARSQIHLADDPPRRSQRWRPVMVALTIFTTLAFLIWSITSDQAPRYR